MLVVVIQALWYNICPCTLTYGEWLICGYTAVKAVLWIGEEFTPLYIRGDADKSLARPTSRCRKTESIVLLERGVRTCAELRVFSCYRDWKEAYQATRAISTTSRRELLSRFFFSCKARRRRNFTPFWKKH